MTAKEYLLRYQNAYNKAQDIEANMTQLRLKYALPSAIQYSDMPKAHNVNHDLSDYMAKMDELTNNLVQQYCVCMGIEGDILQRLDRMESSKESRLLRLRYTYIRDDGKLMYWEDVADRMGFTRQHVDRLHGIALLHFPMEDVL